MMVMVHVYILYPSYFLMNFEYIGLDAFMFRFGTTVLGSDTGTVGSSDRVAAFLDMRGGRATVVVREMNNMRGGTRIDAVRDMNRTRWTC